MKSINPRRAVALGTLACALGVIYVVSGRLLAETPPSNQGVPISAERAKTAVPPAGAQNDGPTIRSVKVTASRYRFDPPIIDVFQDDLVKIEVHTEDIAHSLTIDAYRIAKRVSPAQPVTFEFRADQAGTFSYYCNLQIDDGCRQMRGRLVVRPRR
ncbi:MAG: cupredoxin domain-containing protein [Acidobacteriota bacterium]